MPTSSTSSSKLRPRRPKAARSNEGTATYTAPLLKVYPSNTSVEQHPPALCCASTTITGRPRRDSESAAANPDSPAPITTVGNSLLARINDFPLRE
ncbi:protein of unknown function (plasmid) [Cupriavidus neocaledonicus]|uniref:Uncharacterized protein n=1 Tax=Cupriavidus neocaledonicus TaxID=1040979 RepID=A0A375HNT7_9BURK|nr:protein of unknown function [Cupriavidus neocaledonicus]